MPLDIANLLIDAAVPLGDPRGDRLFVKHKHRRQRVLTADIRYVEAQRAYCKLCTRQTDFTLSISLAALERQLPPCNLIRIHRSYLVNLLCVEAITERGVVVAGREFPLSRAHREEVLDRLRVIH